jgi:hypothetical protein
MSLTLPTWDKVSDKIDHSEKLNPLEQFIYDNEPAEDDEQWRESLELAIEYVTQ